MFDPEQPLDLRENYPGGVNEAHDAIYANIRANIRRQLPQLQAHAPNDYKALLLCGGPSLGDNVAEIKRKRKRGWKLITVNGTHEWAMDHGMTPSLHVMLDARRWNRRFVAHPADGCRYMVASQCHPSVFDALDGHDVHIWHAGASSDEERRIFDSYYLKRWQVAPGGSSVGTRAIGLAMMIGIRRLEVFGLDSCYRDGEHHAYKQTENDYNGKPWRVKIGRRVFTADPWMVKQADEFCIWAKTLPDDFKLTVKGNGLIAYLISETAAGRKPKRRIL